MCLSSPPVAVAANTTAHVAAAAPAAPRAVDGRDGAVDEPPSSLRRTRSAGCAGQRHSCGRGPAHRSGGGRHGGSASNCGATQRRAVARAGQSASQLRNGTLYEISRDKRGEGGMSAACVCVCVCLCGCVSVCVCVCLCVSVCLCLTDRQRRTQRKYKATSVPAHLLYDANAAECGRCSAGLRTAS